MPHHHTLAMITIGQSPRHDYDPDLPSLLPPNTTLLQRGALDALSLADVTHQLSPDPDPDPDSSSDPGSGAGAKTHVLVSRMRDGTPVSMDAAKLAPLLDACVARTARESRVDALLLLCTGDVPTYPDLGVPVVSPQSAVRAFFESRMRGRKMVVVSPEGRQVDAARRRWEGVGGCVVVGAVAATPYGEASLGELEGVVRERGRRGEEWEGAVVYLDCMGFTLEQKRWMARETGLEVVVPREVVFGAVGSMFNEG